MDNREDIDILVVGGGINGAGIVRDAAGRGLRVMLVEREDLAQHTSAASTKILHGGLQYLENFEFARVGHALAEREILRNAAPHITQPLRFVMIHDDRIRSRSLSRIKLFIYDFLARKFSLPGSRVVTLADDEAGKPLREDWQYGYEFSAVLVDDARLVALNCVDAAERGAQILTRTACVAAQRDTQGWRVTLRDAQGKESQVSTRVLVNATGPWIENFLAENAGLRTRHHVRLARGSHIVVPRLQTHDKAYILQNEDGRIVFVLPYEHDYTLIGTTEIAEEQLSPRVQISTDELHYLCDTVNRFFRTPISAADVRWSYSGLRPLLDDEHFSSTRVMRDYMLELNGEDAPLLSVFGGRITTYRQLAEEAVGRLQNLLGHDAPAWTNKTPLPGGDMPAADFMHFFASLQEEYAFMPTPLLLRFAHAYGTRARAVLGSARSTAELGQEILPGLYERELDYLMRVEWARSADDILWRRSKLGLHLGAGAAVVLDNWLRTKM